MRVEQVISSAIIMVAIAGSVSAATVTSVANSSNNGGWNEAAVWSSGVAPVGTDDYVIDGEDVTCAKNGSSTFSGGSLTVTSGTLRMTRSSSTASATAANMTLSGGQLLLTAGTYNATLNWQSAINFAAGTTSTIKLSGGSYSVYGNLNGILTGSGNVNVIIDRADTYDSRSYVIANYANGTFSGNWTVTGYDNGAVGYLRANAANALGTGTVTLNSRGALNVTAANGIDSITNVTLATSTSKLMLTHAWSNNTATLTMTAGTLNLGAEDSYVAAMTVAGVSVDQGTYTADDLTLSYYGLGVSFSGSGTITVLDAVGGGDITSVADNYNNNAWNDASVWSDGEAAAGTNDYTIDGEDVTCAQNSSSTFSGKSLTVTSGNLRMTRTSGGTAYAAAANLTLAGGQLLFRTTTQYNSYFNWQSSITFAAGTTSAIQLNGGKYEVKGNLNGPLAGSGNVNVIINRADTGDSRSYVVANYGDSSFSGNWNVTGLDSGAVGYLSANAANALGTGTVILGSRGALEVTAANGIDSLANITLEESTSLLKLTHAWSNETATLTMADGTLDLADTTNYIHRLYIAGKNVETGSYTATDLTALGYGGTFTGTGELNITYEAEGTVISIR